MTCPLSEEGLIPNPLALNSPGLALMSPGKCGQRGREGKEALNDLGSPVAPGTRAGSRAPAGLEWLPAFVLPRPAEAPPSKT